MQNIEYLIVNYCRDWWDEKYSENFMEFDYSLMRNRELIGRQIRKK